MATYYTPTVEDLVFGLEFELYNNKDNSWDKRCILYGHAFGDARNEIVINKSNIRIKHLDEDDILELGWKFYSDAMNLKHYTLDKYIITFNPHITSIFIYDTGDNFSFYRGICKNKAELKRLMNNLSITNK